MQQPFSGWAKTLLERQDYPDLRLYPGGPPKRPYDVTAQTLPLQMGVEVATVNQKFDATLKSATQFAFELNHPIAAGALAASDVYSWKEANKIWKSGKPVYRDTASGDFFAAAGDGRRSVSAPRIGIYKSFIPSMDEGWTRWLLEDFGFVYSSVENKEIQAGALRKHFDVIVFPDATPASMENGYSSGSMPPEFTGGLGPGGADALREFASAGGKLIFLNRASDYATLHLGVAARNVVHGVSSSEYYSPGSILNARLDLHHPLAAGLPQDLAIWSEQSPAWDTQESAPVRYPEANLLASGWLLGAKYLAGKAALVDARGRGRNPPGPRRPSNAFLPRRSLPWLDGYGLLFKPKSWKL